MISVYLKKEIKHIVLAWRISNVRISNASAIAQVLNKNFLIIELLTSILDLIMTVTLKIKIILKNYTLYKY